MISQHPAALFLVDKPTGPTSHDIVQELRRWTGVRRVGHGGTLDPLATGLLPVFVGAATRLIEYLGEHRKSYAASVRLGVDTDTNDAEGAVLSEAPVPPLTVTDIDAALAPFRGEIMQTPPTYSAIKVAGVAAHRAARRGQPLTIAPRPVKVHALAVEGWSPPVLRLGMTVGTGTYVRAIARDLGAALGCGAHVTEMRRTRIGPVGVEEAHSPAALASAFAEDRGWALADSPARFLTHWPHLTLSDDRWQEAVHGRTLAGPVHPAAKHALALNRSGDPVAVLAPDPSTPGQWRPVKVLAGGTLRRPPPD